LTFFSKDVNEMFFSKNINERKIPQKLVFMSKKIKAANIILNSYFRYERSHDRSVKKHILQGRLWSHIFGTHLKRDKVFWKCMEELPHYHKFRTAFRIRVICESHQQLIDAERLINIPQDEVLDALCIDKDIRRDLIFHNYGDYGFAGLNKSLEIIKELGGSEESFFDPNVLGSFYRQNMIEDFKLDAFGYEHTDCVSTRMGELSVSLDSSNCSFNLLENLGRFTEIFPDGYTLIDILLQQINVVVMFPEFYNFFTFLSLIIDLV